jgi:hypothetical protein
LVPKLKLGVAFAFDQLAGPGLGQDHAVLGNNISPADGEDGPAIKFLASIDFEILI